MTAQQNSSDSALLGSRYRVLRPLGSGGMGEVHLVEDTRRDGRVMALKTMSVRADEAAIESFKAEFRSIRRVVHPNIPEVYDFGILPPPDGRLYFTCEYVEGESLEKLSDEWSTEQLELICVRLCRALAFLHSRGLLHRDVKPENMLGRLDGEGGFTSLKLVDFGLAVAKGETAMTGGTVDYMAPELIEGAAPTVASDVYAAGMLLYRLAAGRLPFTGDDPLAIAHQRCATEAPPPLRFCPDLPVGLSDVICTLIRTKPEERPPSARHVIALLNERQGTDFPYETPETRSAYIQSAASVTQGDTRRRLDTHCTRLRQGNTPPPVFVLSEAGLGRKRLLRELASELSVEGLPVAVVEPEGEWPLPGSVRALFLPDATELSADHLVALAAAHRDGAWCVIGLRDPAPQLAEALPSAETITLRPLDLAGVQQFIAGTFPENTFPEHFAQQIYTTTLGFPAAIKDTLDLLLDTDALRIGLSGWELLPGYWGFPVHRVVAQHIEAICSALTDGARRLVNFLACSLAPLPEGVLKPLFRSGEVAGSIEDTTAELDRIGWLDHTPHGFRLHFAAVADHISELLAEEQRRTIHRLLALAWAAVEMSEHEARKREILFHDFHAGVWTVAPSEAAATIRSVIQAGDSHWVRRLVESCLVNSPPPALRRVMLDALTTIEYIEGNIQASAEHLGEIVENGNAPVTEENLEPLARYGMLEERLGHIEQAEAVLERCLHALPDGPDDRAGVIYGTLARIAFKRGEADKARRLAEEGLVRVPPRSADPGQAMLLNTVGTLAFYRGEMDAASMYWNRCLEVHEALKDRKGVSLMYNNLGALAAQTGDRRGARSLWHKCAGIAREMSDVGRLAGIYNNLGIDALENGHLAEAEEYYLKALALFRRMKSPREQVEILSNLGELAYYRADYPRAQAYLQEAVSLGSTLDDLESEIEPLVYLGKLLLTLDDLETAASVLERACRTAREVGSKKGEGQAWEALALLQSRRGRKSDARDAIQRSRTLLSEDIAPAALAHLYLTECAIAAESDDQPTVRDTLSLARKTADVRWDPFTAARMLVYGLLFAHEQIDPKDRPRILRQLSVYPDFLWRFHWASARRLAASGAVRRALDEYGRGASVLKAVAQRLSEEGRKRYLSSPYLHAFRDEAMAARKSLAEK